MRERVLLLYFAKKKEAPKSWYFPKATHLVSEGPGIHPQTGLTLKPAVVLSSWPWCLIHVNNYNTSQKEISSMRGTDKLSREFREGRRGLWMRATGKDCNMVVLLFGTSASEDSREGGRRIWTVGGGMWNPGVCWRKIPEGYCVCVCVCITAESKKVRLTIWV